MKNNLKKLKINKKVKSFGFVALFVLVAMLVIPIMSAFADATPKFYFEAISNDANETTVDLNHLNRGDEFKLNVMLSDAINFQSMSYTIVYDNTAFEYIGKEVFSDTSSSGEEKVTTASANLTDQTNPNLGLVSFSVAVSPKYENNYSYSGKIATIIFRVKNTARKDYQFEFRTGSTNGALDTNIKRLVQASSISPDGEYSKAVYQNLNIETETISAFVEVPTNSFSMSVDNHLEMIVDDELELKVTPDNPDTTVLENLSVVSNQKDFVDFIDGKIVAKKTGNAILTVYAYGSSKTISVNVTNPLKRLYFDSDNITIKGLSKNEKLTVNMEPLNPDDKSLEWESLNTDVLDVDQLGNITVKKAGDAVVRVKSLANPSISTEITVHVIIPVTNASINKENLNLVKDGTDDIIITYEPNVVETDVTWTFEDNGIAIIEEEKKEAGKFTAKIKALTKGNTKLKAKLTNCDDDVNCEFVVNINVKVQLESIKIQKDGKDVTEIELYPNEKVNLTVSVYPLDADLPTDNPVWTSKFGNVTVSNGVVTGVNKDTTDTVTVSYGGLEATVDVKVKTPIEGGNLLPAEDVNLITDCSSSKGICEKQLSVVFFPDTADEKPTVTWGIKEGSSNDVVSVSPSGLVRALKAGDTTVTATYTTITGDTIVLEKNVHVTVALENIHFEKESLTIHRNNTAKLPDLVIEPSDATVAMDDIVYTFDDEFINLDNGIITALKKGTVTLIAKLGSYTAALNIIIDVPVEDFVVKNADEEITSLIIPRNSSTVLTVDVSPSDAYFEDVSFGIVEGQRDDVISINATTGAINALQKGKTKVFVKVGEITKVIEIEVNVPVESFTAVENMEIYKGENNKTLISTMIKPADADFTTITWESDNEEIATVDDAGFVTGHKEGTANITGTLGNGMKVEILVTVKGIPLNDINIEVLEEILKGRTTVVKVTPDPIDSTEFENIEYESDDTSIFTVDQDGIITALKEGKATLTVRVGEITKEIEITIKEIHAESLSVYVEENSLKVGESIVITPYANPKDCTDQLTYTFEVSDENIATIDENGVITGVSAGNVTVTIKADNGLTTTTEIKVVENKPVVSPDTKVNSPIPYVVISFISLVGIAVFAYKKWRIEK